MKFAIYQKGLLIRPPTDWWVRYDTGWYGAELKILSNEPIEGPIDVLVFTEEGLLKGRWTHDQSSESCEEYEEEKHKYKMRLNKDTDT